VGYVTVDIATVAAVLRTSLLAAVTLLGLSTGWRRAVALQGYEVPEWASMRRHCGGGLSYRADTPCSHGDVASRAAYAIRLSCMLEDITANTLSDSTFRNCITIFQ
jgi:hypothetical protein